MHAILKDLRAQNKCFHSTAHTNPLKNINHDDILHCAAFPILFA